MIGIIPMNARDLDEALEMGMDWSLREGYVWPEDKEHCEEYGRMLNANPAVVSTRAKKRGVFFKLSFNIFEIGTSYPAKIDEKLGEVNKSCWTIDIETFATISGIRWSLLDLCNAELLNVTGLPQLGTLGAGNHYAEIQVVDEIFDKFAASRMGIDRVGQVVVMIHCGSRGFGHQVGSMDSTHVL